MVRTGVRSSVSPVSQLSPFLIWRCHHEKDLFSSDSCILDNAATFPAPADEGFYVIGMDDGVGVKITSLPKVITSPGFYYVTGNLACPAGHGITVNSDNVTIDLMGFCLSGNDSSYGITGTGSNVEVRNGALTGWDRAIDMWGVQNRIINVRAQGAPTA